MGISKAEYVISEEHGLIIEKFTGKMTLDLVKTASESIWSQPSYKKSYKGLADLRTCEFDMNLRDIIKMVMFLAKSDKTATGFFVILVKSADGVAKSLIFNSRIGSIMNLHVVSHLDSALRHLAITQEIYDKINSQDKMLVKGNE
jgi:hypothetical protein